MPSLLTCIHCSATVPRYKPFAADFCVPIGPRGKEPVGFSAFSALWYSPNDHHRRRAGWEKHPPPGHHFWYVIVHTRSANIANSSLYFVEKFEDTESTCGVATCDVINVHGDDWNTNKTPEAVKLMRRQMVPKCRVCKAALKVSDQSICVSCATVCLPSCLLCSHDASYRVVRRAYAGKTRGRFAGLRKQLYLRT